MRILLPSLLAVGLALTGMNPSLAGSRSHGASFGYGSGAHGAGVTYKRPHHRGFAPRKRLGRGHARFDRFRPRIAYGKRHGKRLRHHPRHRARSRLVGRDTFGSLRTTGEFGTLGTFGLERRFVPRGRGVHPLFVTRTPRGNAFGGYDGFDIRPNLRVNRLTRDLRPYGTPRFSPEYLAYCSNKYRSFDPRTGHYKTHSGYVRPCNYR